MGRGYSRSVTHGVPQELILNLPWLGEIEQILRGYEDIVEKLQNVGAKIEII